KTTARFETARITSGLLVKGIPYTSFRAKTRVKKMNPNVNDDIMTHTIANLAALGLLAPSSFDILTLCHYPNQISYASGASKTKGK
ncbi:hypothetical protein BHM03_00058878, partial [Ensete ventricosum]